MLIHVNNYGDARHNHYACKDFSCLRKSSVIVPYPTVEIVIIIIKYESIGLYPSIIEYPIIPNRNTAASRNERDYDLFCTASFVRRDFSR